jgi:demethylmenaquinone methyltransferase/2-methoxy-6-polyprenyl-1,4-benzoquinol methylase
VSEDQAYVQALQRFDPLMAPAVCEAIRILDLPMGSEGLDAGCGIGLQALLFAGAVGPSGHVSGIDISPTMTRHAERLALEAGMSGRVSFREADVRSLPFDDGRFDWAWSSCCVGYASFLDPVSTLGELARVVKPGGTVAILVWSSENLLPGYPELEAHLRATTSGIAPFERGRDPGSHFLRALGWYRRLGLQEPRAHTIAIDAQAPLSVEVRAALVSLFDMRWPGAEAELTEEDQLAYRRLCSPESPAFIVDCPDYYAFFTYTLFQGRVAE